MEYGYISLLRFELPMSLKRLALAYFQCDAMRSLWICANLSHLGQRDLSGAEEQQLRIKPGLNIGERM